MSTVYRIRHYSVLYRKQNLTGYTILQKKWWDRHKGHGSEKNPVPVWPNVRQKKTVFAKSATDIGSVTGITCLTTDIGSVTGITCLTTDICSVTGIHFKY